MGKKRLTTQKKTKKEKKIIYTKLNKETFKTEKYVLLELISGTPEGCADSASPVLRFTLP